jgi:hypothetical protein
MTTLPHPLFTHFDDSFSIHLSRNYNLCILVGQDRFSFCFSRSDDNSLIGLESYNFNIADPQQTVQGDAREWCNGLTALLGNLESLKKPFHQVKIAFESHKATLIPKELFNEKNMAEFMLINHPLMEFEICRHEALPHLKAEIIYAMPFCIVSALQTFFPEGEISNASGQLIEILLEEWKEPAINVMLYANVQGAWIEVICIEQGKLRYFNSFQYRTREDLAYYIIFILEQLGLNPDTITLMLLGTIERESERFELLYRYIRNIRFVEYPLTNTDRLFASSIPISNFYNLLSFAKCG